MAGGQGPGWAAVGWRRQREPVDGVPEPGDEAEREDDERPEGEHGQRDADRAFAQEPPQTAFVRALVVVNTVIAGTMNSLETRREVEVTRRLETMEKLLAAERENAALQVRIADQAREAGVLDERARLSREIHDTVAQGLVGIVRQREAIDPRGPEAEWRARVDTAAESARDSLAEARRAVAALASPRLDVDDLPTAPVPPPCGWPTSVGFCECG